jgi:hypothetical protein
MLREILDVFRPWLVAELSVALTNISPVVPSIATSPHHTRHAHPSRRLFPNLLSIPVSNRKFIFYAQLSAVPAQYATKIKLFADC